MNTYSCIRDDYSKLQILIKKVFEKISCIQFPSKIKLQTATLVQYKNTNMIWYTALWAIQLTWSRKRQYIPDINNKQFNQMIQHALFSFKTNDIHRFL